MNNGLQYFCRKLPKNHAFSPEFTGNLTLITRNQIDTSTAVKYNPWSTMAGAYSLRTSNKSETLNISWSERVSVHHSVK